MIKHESEPGIVRMALRGFIFSLNSYNSPNAWALDKAIDFHTFFRPIFAQAMSIGGWDVKYDGMFPTVTLKDSWVNAFSDYAPTLMAISQRHMDNLAMLPGMVSDPLFKKEVKENYSAVWSQISEQMKKADPSPTITSVVNKYGFEIPTLVEIWKSRWLL